jgi:hypothetical protein
MPLAFDKMEPKSKMRQLRAYAGRPDDAPQDRAAFGGNGRKGDRCNFGKAPAASAEVSAAISIFSTYKR